MIHILISCFCSVRTIPASSKKYDELNYVAWWMMKKSKKRKSVFSHVNASAPAFYSIKHNVKRYGRRLGSDTLQSFLDLSRNSRIHNILSRTMNHEPRRPNSCRSPLRPTRCHRAHGTNDGAPSTEHVGNAPARGNRFFSLWTVLFRNR